MNFSNDMGFRFFDQKICEEYGNIQLFIHQEQQSLQRIPQSTVNEIFFWLCFFLFKMKLKIKN
jgi:hypothetical protein